MEVLGLRKREKNFFLALLVFFEKQKENKVCVQAIAYIAISCNGLPHIMKGAGLVRLLDGWNTDSVLVPLLLRDCAIIIWRGGSKIS